MQQFQPYNSQFDCFIYQTLIEKKVKTVLKKFFFMMERPSSVSDTIKSARNEVKRNKTIGDLEDCKF